MIKDIYIALKQRIQQCVLEVKQIDWYFEQYNNGVDGDNLVWVTPSVYIEFEDIEYESIAQGAQRANIVVQIHVVSDCGGYGADDRRITDNIDDITLTHLDVCQKIFHCLHLFNCTYEYLDNYVNNENMLINTMRRVSSNTTHNLSPFMVTVMSYEFVGYDLSALPNINCTTSPIEPYLDVRYRQ